MQHLALVVVEPAVGGQVDERLRAEQVVEQLSGGEDGPHPLQRLAHLWCGAQPFADLVSIDGDPGALGEGGEDRRLDMTAAGVVVAEAPAGVGHDRPGLGDRESQGLQPVANPQLAAQRALPIADRTIEHPGHAQVALDACRVGAVAALDAQLVSTAGALQQVGQHGQLDTGLAEAGQDLLDVPEEQSVGPEHEHSLALEREAVRVEQVSSAVKCHDGLTGAGTTLNHEHTWQLGPDDLVLLGLDGGDDVAEPTGAVLLQRSDQRGATAGSPRCRRRW